MKRIVLAMLLLCCGWAQGQGADPEMVAKVTEAAGAPRGLCVVLGKHAPETAVALARGSAYLIYAQVPASEKLEAARERVDQAGFYGARVFVEQSAGDRIFLADNIADVVFAAGGTAGLPEAEILRVLRPNGKALLGKRVLTKPFPSGMDDWSHPYHGPDNNPVSRDTVACAPYLTQFLSEPRYAPLPQVAVASAGRVFKAFGNVAFKRREEEYLNTVVALNGYNGSILWKRPLTEGFPIHRNVMIATPDLLYLGDDTSCKRIDTATGQLVDEIVMSKLGAEGVYWKWMALEDGVLYALTGEPEPRDTVERWQRTAHGWPWNKVSEGYNDEEYRWGFGRTVLAIDTKTKKILWMHQEQQAADTRAMCMRDGKIYIFRFGAYLSCLDAATGRQLWRRTPDDSAKLFDILDGALPRQGYATNWKTVAYVKCTDDALYFAGPQIDRLLAVSTKDGSILWENGYDNFQLILRDDALYAISGPWADKSSRKFDPLTGQILAELDFGRRACTRVTASADAIFCRAMGGTQRLDAAGDVPQWLPAMRPQCHDGVTIANGMLYWWPSTCDCQLSLYGVTALGPAGGFASVPEATEPDRLQTYTTKSSRKRLAEATEADWPVFRGNNQSTAGTSAVVAEKAAPLWQQKIGDTPTAPVACGGLIYVADGAGVVRAFAADSGKEKWRAYTGGAVRFPPAIAEGRAYVGSGDGYVYAYNARTGALEWRFRAAPAERRMPVYGRLLSTWPAAAVLVDKDVVYAAAGIVNYDGTYVFALDAATGQVKWANDSSGRLNPELGAGVSAQGQMLIHNGKLYLAGGTAVSPAIYDITDGTCLNTAEDLKIAQSTAPRGWELALVGGKVVSYGMPLYSALDIPIYDQTVTEKISIASSATEDLVWLNNKRLSCYTPRLDQAELAAKVNTQSFTGHIIKPWGQFRVAQKPAWEFDLENSRAFARGANAAVLAGETELVALRLTDGEVIWRSPLPAKPVPWGLAIDRNGRCIATLEDGTILSCGG